MAKKKGKLSNFQRQGADTYNSRNKGAINFDSFLNLDEFDLERFKDKANTDYVIDILPYTVETDNHPTREKGESVYNLDIWVHPYLGSEKGSYLCMKATFGEPCEVCKEFLKQQDAGEEWDDIRHLYPSRKSIYAIKHEGKVYIYVTSFKTFEEHWLMAVEKKKKKGKDVFPVYLDEEGSMSLEFSTTKKKGIGKYIQFDFVEIEDYDKSILEEIPSLEKLLVIPDQEKLLEILDGLEGGNFKDKDDENEDTDKDDKKKGKKSNKKGKEKEEKNDENENKEYLKQAENIDVDKDDKEPPAPKTKQKKKKKNDEEEVVCPYDTTFGEDWDGYEHCDKCANTNPEEYEKCKAKFKELEE